MALFGEMLSPTNLTHSMEKHMLNDHAWLKEFPGAVTVCDASGMILEMNDKAMKTFADQGGEKLIGCNLMECHPEAAQIKLQDLLNSRKPNAYTIEKKGVKKMIYQSPWYRDGEYAGFVELSLEIPFEMAHFVRAG
jgi:transcriptional regulator with PAS, ATPase and Fis domain